MNQASLYAYNYYLQRGYSPAAAAGITGNLMVESGRFAPDVISGARRGDQGTAAYAAQWRGERLNNLNAYAKQNGMEPSSLDAQLGFVDHEMRNRLDGGAGIAFQKLQSAQNPAEAAHYFMKYYERPNADPAINHIALRQDYANRLVGTPQQQVAAPAMPTLNTAQAQAQLANQSAANMSTAQGGIASLGPQAVASLPTVQQAAANTAMQTAQVAQAAAAPAAAAAPVSDPIAGLFGLMMSARAAPAAPSGGTDTTVPRPKVIDNRTPEQQMASVSQTPNVYEERMKRRATYG